jgi:hypothetical protein
MFRIFGKKYRHCDGITRRHFLTAGALGIGGMTLADLLRAEAMAGIGSSTKAVINIHLDGGPPHMDMIDPKPGAPLEIRGEFKPIATSIPGIQICELMPKLASIAGHLAFVRSLVGSDGAHDAFQCQSGFPGKDLASVGGRPAMGSILAKLRGSAADPAPSFVDLMQGRPLVRDSARPGFLGPSYQPFRPDISQMFSRPLEPGMVKELAARGDDHRTSLKLIGSLTADRMTDRTRLLATLDRIKRDVDSTGTMDAMDQFTRQAVGILTSGRFADAMDLSKEDPKVVERYTLAHNKDAFRFATGEDESSTKKLLLARRLVEAGVRCVSVSFSDFDTHSENFPRIRQLLPLIDHAIHALVTDLDERGMLDDVSIVAWGEFGRTPKINKNGGRDHWPNVGPALLAGGGMNVGQAIGETDRDASAVLSRPIHYQDVFATLYHNLGIDLASTTIADPNGRPQFLLDRGKPIPELASSR